MSARRKLSPEEKLHISVIEGDIKGIKKYLQSSFTRRKVSIECRDQYGRTPLHLAVNSLHTTKFLVETIGADPSAKRPGGFSVLTAAASRGNVDVIRYYMEDLCLDDFGENAQGMTPFLFAVLNGRLEAVKYFIQEQNQDLMVMDKDGLQAIHYAVKAKRNAHFLTTFLVEETDINIFAKTANGELATDLTTDPILVALLDNAMKIRGAPNTVANPDSSSASYQPPLAHCTTSEDTDPLPPAREIVCRCQPSCKCHLRKTCVNISCKALNEHRSRFCAMCATPFPIDSDKATSNRAQSDRSVLVTNQSAADNIHPDHVVDLFDSLFLESSSRDEKLSLHENNEEVKSKTMMLNESTTTHAMSLPSASKPACAPHAVPILPPPQFDFDMEP